MAYSVKQANEYIAANVKSVKGKFRPKYHMTAPIGWMNDPNGSVYYHGAYHLFYQYNPYGEEPSVMHWGHFVSTDLITYTDESVALAPTEKDETSCYSGGAVVAGGALNILYTRHYEIKDEKKEQVCMVRSTDGKTFVKKHHPVFNNETLPENISRADFRDPFPIMLNDKFYVFVGGTDRELKKGVVVVLKGNSLEKLEYAFTIGPYDCLGDMAECPCYCKVDGKDVLIVSGCHVKEQGNDYKNTHASVFIVGELDFENGRMSVDYVKEIDKGDAFYAPQVISNIERPIIVSWQEMWNKSYPTRDMEHGWVGSFTIPRELKLCDGDIIQTPISELDNYLKSDRDIKDVIPKCADIRASFDGKGSLVLLGSNGQIVIGNDGGVYLDTVNSNNGNGCIRRTNGHYASTSVRILLDVSGVEIFVDDGREVISSRMYIDGDFTISVDGNVKDITIKEIGVPV
ncbi:MAG: GH32 C-terminal domain-containing protein [Clostridiales bacterium]|nr:GH32 C-terminal domain-containing protein [Clostridiales bacterium]